MSGVHPGGSKCCDWLCSPWKLNADVTPPGAEVGPNCGETEVGVRLGDDERLPVID